MSEIVIMPVDTPEDLAEVARRLSQFVGEVALSRDPGGNWSATYEGAWALDAQPAALLADLLRGHALREIIAAEDGRQTDNADPLKPVARLNDGEKVSVGDRLVFGGLPASPPMVVMEVINSTGEVKVAWFNADLMLIHAILPSRMFLQKWQGS